MPELEERIAVLETQQLNMQDKIDAMTEKVDEMHEVLIQARGMRWLAMGAVGLFGFMAGKIEAVSHFFASKP